MCECVLRPCRCVHTSATLSSKGSNQWSLHSQWESKKVRTGAVAASAPRTLERIRPRVRKKKKTLKVLLNEHNYKTVRKKPTAMKKIKNSSSPSLRSFLNTRTFSILPSSAPSSAETEREPHDEAGDSLTAINLSRRVFTNCITYGCRCSRPPKWFLWPGEQDFFLKRYRGRRRVHNGNLFEERQIRTRSLCCIVCPPDHRPQQSGAGLVVEGDDHAGRRQVWLPLLVSATLHTEWQSDKRLKDLLNVQALTSAMRCMYVRVGAEYARRAKSLSFFPDRFLKPWTNGIQSMSSLRDVQKSKLCWSSSRLKAAHRDTLRGVGVFVSSVVPIVLWHQMCPIFYGHHLKIDFAVGHRHDRIIMWCQNIL